MSGNAAKFKLSSPAFQDSGSIPQKFTCQGENKSPELNWSEAPASTQSLALIMDDPDAPGGTFTHWVLFDIPADHQQTGGGRNTDRGERLEWPESDRLHGALPAERHSSLLLPAVCARCAVAESESRRIAQRSRNGHEKSRHRRGRRWAATNRSSAGVAGCWQCITYYASLVTHHFQRNNHDCHPDVFRRNGRADQTIHVLFVVGAGCRQSHSHDARRRRVLLGRPMANATSI